MKIKKIDCFFLYYPFDRPIGNATTYFRGKHANIIKITTECGIQGYGESFGNQDVLYKHFKMLIPSMIGASIDTWDHLEEEIENKLLTANVEYLNRSAIKSAFNIAFWDIKGKDSNKTVSELFGFTPIKQVPVYGTGFFYENVENYTDQLPYFSKELNLFLKKGYKGIKMKIGKYAVDEDIWLIKQIQDQLSNDVKLMIDANCGIKDLKTAKKIINELDSLNIDWLEEPFDSNDYESYNKTTNGHALKIAAGEHESSIKGIKKLIQSGVSIIQPELTLCGGFSIVNTLINTVNKQNIILTPHVWGSGINYGASLQFYSIVNQSKEVLYECPFLNDPLRDECFENTFISNGDIDTPSNPGIGVIINMKQLKKYTRYFLSA